MDYIECFISQYEKSIDLIKWILLLGLAIYSSLRIRLMSKKNRYDFFKEMRNDYIDRELLEKRNNIANFWLSKKFTKHNNDKTGSINCPELSKANSFDEFQTIIRTKLGLEMKVKEIDETFIKNNKKSIACTEDVLNVYEHLGKLIDAGIISIKDTKIFFYTMMADTFISCLPFILYRRKSKPEYAHKIQKLIKHLPKVSSDISRV